MRPALTTFVGRTRDMEQLKHAVQASRLVTLIGPGGVGKTRLVTEFAALTSDTWEDGVNFVDLARVDDPTQVSETIASTLGLDAAGDAIQKVGAWLQPKTALLILDNCEHVLEACADFCDRALTADAKWALIATSRQALGVAGEQRLPVSPLEEAAAVELFIDRARHIAPNLKLRATDRDAVREICRKVDDLPLAIELVAARAGLLSPVDLLSTLETRLQPVFSARSKDPRHATLLATIEWSYRLLTEPEARLFARLSVFRGGFGFEAVEEVCGHGLGGDSLATLAGLVDKSMVVVEGADDLETRYRLLDSQAEYADSKLRESGELDAVRRRHYEYFRQALLKRTNVTWAPDPARTLVTSADNRWKRRELDNFWTALQWARHGADDFGVEMFLALQQGTSGNIARKRAWVRDILDNAPDLGPMTSWAIGAAAGLAWNARDMDESIALAKRRLARVVRDGDWMQQALTLTMIGNASQDLDFGLGEEAEQAHRQALAVLEGHEAPALESTILNNLGCSALIRGDAQRSLALLEDAVRIARPVSGPIVTANIIESLASAQLGCGLVEDAERSWKECITLAVDSDNHYEISTFLNGLARAAAFRRDYARAARLAAATARLSREHSFVEQRYWLAELDKAIAVCRVELGKRFDEAWAEGSALSADAAIDYALRDDLAPPTTGPLSKRESQVVTLVALGRTNREVAANLFLSERTVEGHLDRIRAKLGLTSRAEIGAWAVTNGLVSGPDRSRSPVSSPVKRGKRPGAGETRWPN